MTKTALLQGTLEMLILGVLSGELRGRGFADRIEFVSKEGLNVEEGSLYPALFRLKEQGRVALEWGVSDNNRKSKFYRITKAGRGQLRKEHRIWTSMTVTIGGILRRA